MHPAERNEAKRRKIDEEPFRDLKVADWSFLHTIKDRSTCEKCGKSRKYFCYICYVPVPALRGRVPELDLPIKIDIIKHRNEIDGKSTAAHAAVLAPRDVRVFVFPQVPDYRSEEGVVLVYPGTDASTIQDLFSREPPGPGPPITRAVFIDSTWNQSRGIYKDERIKSLPTIVLKNKVSQFWRHQKGSPRWYLATIEAIHELLIEIDTATININNEIKEYDGKYDNLLFFFCFMYSKIHNLYDHDSLLSYKRPLQ